MSQYLFSYGTLQPQHAPAEISVAIAQMETIGSGFINGSLYDLGEYPGAVLEEDSNTRIFGTIFRLPDSPDILQQLDAYEGFDPHALHASLFIRRLGAAHLTNGGKLSCWIYVYNREIKNATRIENGQYRNKQVRA